MIIKRIKKAAKSLCILFVIAGNSVFALVNSLIICCRLVGSKRPIFVNVEGGFGHTLAAPTCLQSLIGEDFYLIFFYVKERHNYLTREAFDGRFLWCRVTFPGFPFFSLRVHQFLGVALVKVLSSLTVGAHDLRRFFEESSSESWMVESDYYDEYYSDPYRRVYMFRLALSDSEVVARGGSSFYLKKLENNPLGRLISTRRRICAIAHRAYEKSGDITKSVRNSRSLSELVGIVNYLTDTAGYHVILCGHVHGKELDLFASNPFVTYPAKTNLCKDAYDFYAGMLFDVFIGPMSGALDYARCRQVPTLILDSFPYGWSSPRATLAFRDKKFSGNDELRKFFLKSYQDYTVSEVGFVPEAVALSVVREFIENVNNSDFGIDPLDLGIYDGPLVDGRCRIAPAWYKHCVQGN